MQPPSRTAALVLRCRHADHDTAPVAQLVGAFVFPIPTWRRVLSPLHTDESALPLVQWLHGTNVPEDTVKRASYDPRTPLDIAAAMGFASVVRFLHAHSTTGATTAAVDAAAANGHVAIVAFLLANRTERCTVAAMNAAAPAGDLEMVRLLHEEGSAPSTKIAMDLASRKGHLAVVTYLYEVVRASYSSKSYELAARGGHLEIIKFWHAVDVATTTQAHGEQDEGGGQQRRAHPPWTAQVMIEAAAEGHLAIVEWLYTNNRSADDACVREALEAAKSAGHEDVVRFLQQ